MVGYKDENMHADLGDNLFQRCLSRFIQNDILKIYILVVVILIMQ